MSGSPSIETPTSIDASQSIERSWHQRWGDLSYRKKKCIIEIDGETTTAQRTLSYGLEANNRLEAALAIWWRRRCGFYDYMHPKSSRRIPSFASGHSTI
jgi:hypothetical protein